VSWVIAGLLCKIEQTGGKSGLHRRNSQEPATKGNAPGNARGLTSGFAGANPGCGYGKCHRKLNRRCRFNLGGRLSEKPEARLFRSNAFGKGEKVG